MTNASPASSRLIATVDALRTALAESPDVLSFTLGVTIDEETAAAAEADGVPREFLDFCRDHDIPRPTLNAVVHGYEVDALWKEEKLIVELDSWEFHRGRRSFEEDRRRSAALQRAGFSVLRLTHRMLNEEAEESAATILDLLTSVREVTR